MDYIFYQAAAINGFDAVGHYLRAGLIVNQCATYAVAPVAGLLGELPALGARPPRREGERERVDAAGDDPVLRATAIALARALGQQVERPSAEGGADDAASARAAPDGRAERRAARGRAPRRDRARRRAATAAPAAARRPPRRGRGAPTAAPHGAADADPVGRAARLPLRQGRRG